MQKPKKFLSVQKKLFASAAMVGVAGIMVASSTYAWFTLSTAPEVTGITTNIGSNGALEMALNTTGNVAGIQTSTNTNANVTERNITWGNLVDLSDPSYGLSNITLYPASLKNENFETPATVVNSIYVPEYDSDGRINKLVAASAAKYTDAGFEVSNSYGVRAFGTSKTMSPQQVALNTAKANVASSIAAMKNTAINVLSSNASKIADIAVKHATAGASDNNTYDTTFIDGMKTQLQGAVTNLDNAIKYYAAAAYAAQSTAGDFTAAEITPEDMTVSYDEDSGTLTITVKTVSINVLPVVKEAYKIKKRISTALGEVGTTSATSTYTVARGLIGKFVNYDKLILQVGAKYYRVAADAIDGYETTQLKKDDIGTFATDYMSAGVVNLLLIEGSGVFADFAQASSNYSASSNFRVEYSGTSVPANAVMKTVVASEKIYNVTTASNGLTVHQNVPTPANQYLSDTYAYVIDLAFRTNASESKLKIQTDGTQRIYSDGTNAETMGGGSNLTLDYSGTGMTVDSLTTLVTGGFKVVFFNTTSKAILQTATLTYNATKSNAVTNTFVADISIAGDQNTKDVICPLTQNTATAISVLVYLDGNVVDNSMVPYLGDLKGTLNLQFSSSAELKPMEYSPLK